MMGVGEIRPSNGTNYANGSLRDSFILSLDENDAVRTTEIAHYLVNCGNPLPNATCVALGLPPGSSYGAGARAFLAKSDGGSVI
jgi:hypothetical protein